MKTKNILIVILALIVQISFLNGQQLKKYTNIYRPLEEKDSYPKTFRELDSRLQVLYEYTYPDLLAKNKNIKDYFNEMDSAEFMQWAKLAVQFYNYPDKITKGFLYTPFKEQRKRSRNAEKIGGSFNEFITSPPEGIIRVIRRKIERDFPWEWGFFIREKYMLVIEVLDKRTGGISFDPSATNPVYTCKVVNDIKGNFTDLKPLELIFRTNNRKMEAVNRYLVLIEGNTIGKGTWFPTYTLSWKGANGKSLFKVENGYILDPDIDLQFDGQSFSIESYSNHVRKFYEMIFEEAGNKN